ncbi:MAG: ComF family protein [Flavobacteriales bacterium]|jgi:ComF family protein
MTLFAPAPAMSIPSLIHDFGALFFPEYCGGCTEPLGRGERCLCATCLMRLPRARLHDLPDNRIEKLFWGRADILMATAFLHMPRRGLTHRLVHELKYRGNQEVGVILGHLFGEEMGRSQRMSSFDLIIPVPLHPKKEHARGYNQCHAICRGLSSAMDIPWRSDLLVRGVWGESQTRKTRFQRWLNTEQTYSLDQVHELEGRHVLLVDDVVTTGATMEACARLLNAVPGAGVSVAALAMPAFS